MEAIAFFVCAARELFEEAGVLLVRDAAGGLLEVEPAEVTLQERLESARLARCRRTRSRSREYSRNGGGGPPSVPFSLDYAQRRVATPFDTRFCRRYRVGSWRYTVRSKRARGCG